MYMYLSVTLYRSIYIYIMFSNRLLLKLIIIKIICICIYNVYICYNNFYFI